MNQQQIKDDIRQALDLAFSNGNLTTLDYEDRLSNLSQIELPLGQLLRLKDNIQSII